MFDLTGKVALVTGAGRGIGAGIARALSEQGATLVINDYFPERAEAMAVELRAGGAEAMAAAFDVSDRAAVVAGMEAITENVGPIDILVTNVGTLPHGQVPVTFSDMPEEEWASHLDNNMYGTLNCIKQVLPGMKKKGWGRLIAITSDSGRLGHYGSSIYSAAKAGMDGLMRTLAKELGTDGITANSIALGLINTVPEEFSRGAEKRYATGRIGTPEDVGPAVVYLASEESSWVSGHCLVVNGAYLGG
jgi:NAD(P)-dependent dehydrogenase (short-subunit alcohol dehydrogenase family)